jgi:hypothetical protein
MNAIGFVAYLFFLVGWAGAFVSWSYHAYHLVMGWFVSTRHDDTPSHRQKAKRGALTVLGCGLFALFNSLIGVTFGGWQVVSGH